MPETPLRVTSLSSECTHGRTRSDGGTSGHLPGGPRPRQPQAQHLDRRVQRPALHGQVVLTGHHAGRVRRHQQPPAYLGGVVVPTFTPPTEDGVAWADPQSMDPADRLMRYYGTVETGVTVWRDSMGIYHRGQYPWAGGATYTTHNGPNTLTTSSQPGVLDAIEVYLGGHTYNITDAQALSLVAAGFQDRINIAPVTLQWTADDLALLQRKTISFTVGDVPASPFLDSANRACFKLASGSSITSPGQRDVWQHPNILYEDFEVSTTLDPFDYATGIPQGGIALRIVEDATHRTIVAINNNVFFFVPVLNVGVWRATLDGSSMFNRQYGFPFPDSLFDPLFPYSFDVRLIDNIVQAPVYQHNTPKPDWVNDLTSNPRSKAINLDTDAGNPAEVALAPTPTGRGGAGTIASHLGTADAGIYRFRTTTFRSLDPGAPQ